MPYYYIEEDSTIGQDEHEPTKIDLKWMKLGVLQVLFSHTTLYEIDEEGKSLPITKKSVLVTDKNGVYHVNEQ